MGRHPLFCPRACRLETSYGFQISREPSEGRAQKLVLSILQGIIVPRAEQKGDAPDTRKGNHRIDDAGHHSRSATADPSNEVELKQTHTPPVEGADDGNNERDAIHNHHKRTYPFRGTLRAPVVIHKSGLPSCGFSSKNSVARDSVDYAARPSVANCGFSQKCFPP